MINRLKQFRDSLSEKTKKYVYIGTFVTVFLISCLLPLAFNAGPLASGADVGDNAAIFARYINSDKNIKSRINTKPGNAQIRFCDNIFNELISSCIIDNSSRKTVSKGQEFIIITDGDTYVELCRMWVQDQGDWTNWVDVYIDAETGFIYYLYLSEVCVYNNSNYLNEFEIEPECKNIANFIAEKSGYILENFKWSGKSEDTAYVYTRRSGDALLWNINCTYHAGSILDIKISVA